MRPKVAVRACQKLGGFKCDYPSIIGNDEYYGGLGGQFVISTRSLTSGTTVLRHEMGHNFVNVGEEYDGGQVYQGVNAATSLDLIGWKNWLTEPGSLKEQSSFLLLQEYAWYDFSQGDYRINFVATGNCTSWMLKLSVSGFAEAGSLAIYLDETRLEWNTLGNKDRSFYTVYLA
jgi:hypothetical protein